MRGEIDTNVLQLTEKLASSPESIAAVLESMGYHSSYVSSRNEFRFAREPGSNPTSCLLDGKTLSFYCFSSNLHGNLFSLVMEKEHRSFPSALNYICERGGFDKSEFSREIKLPFGGFYKKLMRDSFEADSQMKTYPEDILEYYDNGANIRFLRDGIDIQTQQLFKVGYDLETSRITVPEYTMDGKLCGIMGRLNSDDCPHEDRWLPIIPCARGHTLYGFHVNYRNIAEKRVLVIGESEKFVMQCRSFGSSISLATCGCHVSDIQARYIKSLMPEKIILAYDEGLEEGFIRDECKKLISDNCMISNKVGYIWDNENEIIPKDSKKNAADMGKAGYVKLIKEKVKWLDGAT